MDQKIKFGIFSDLHYSPPGSLQRGYSYRTFDDVKAGMMRFKNEKVDFVISLGDNIQPTQTRQEQYELLKTLTSTISGFGIPWHSVFGNHEFSLLSLNDVLEIYQTDRTYYYYDFKGIRFIVLDTNTRPDGVHYSEDNYDWRYGIISDEQLVWLDKALLGTTHAIVFVHNNIYYEDGTQEASWYRISNYETVLSMLTSRNCVGAVFQGHHHTSSVHVHEKIPFINISSPERSEEYSEHDFPIITVSGEEILFENTPYPWLVM